MVSAGKNTIKLIGDSSENYVQCYIGYDSRKAGGATKNYIRLSKNPIRAPYYTENNEFIVCSKDSFVFSIKHLIRSIKPEGIFLLNTALTTDALIASLPNRVKKILAEQKVNFYIIDAEKISRSVGIGQRINTILQSSFFYFNEQFMKYDEAKASMKVLVRKSYGKKGEEIVNANFAAIDAVNKDSFIKVPIDPEWVNLAVNEVNKRDSNIDNDDYTDFVNTMDGLAGDELPVSFFQKEYRGQKIIDGTMISDNITFNQKRQLPTYVPK